MRETDTPCEPELQACALLVRSNVSHAVDGDILVEESDSDALRHINSTLSLTEFIMKDTRKEEVLTFLKLQERVVKEKGFLVM